ncbi:MAG: hypothetical protein ACPGRC_01960, partial [Salibacteraceae bacterium]
MKTFTPSSFNSQGQFVKANGNNVIVAGLFQNSINFGSTVLTNQNNITSIYVANYDTTGVLKWAINGGSVSNSEGIDGLDIDDHGNIYIIGSFVNSTNWGTLTLNTQNTSTSLFNTEGFIVKLDSLGVPSWIEGFYNPTNPLSSNVLQQISIADSSIYVLGSLFQEIRVTNSTLKVLQSNQTPTSNIFISKFNLNGQLLLLDTAISTTNTISTEISGLEAINDSSYYLSGTFSAGYNFGANNKTFSNPNSSFAFVIAKYTGSNCDWLKNSTASSGTFGNYRVRIEISKTNELWFAGSYRGNFSFLGQNFATASFFDFEWFYGKLNSSGGLVDMNSFVSNSTDVQSITENNKNDLLILGSFTDSVEINGNLRYSQGSSDLLLVSIDSSYAINWFQTGGGANADFGLGITSSNSSNAYAISTYQGLSQFGSTFQSSPNSQTSSLLFKIGDCGSNQTPINFSGDTNLCLGESVRIIAAPNAPSTFQWLRDSVILAGEIYRDLSINNSGNYQVIVNGSGCADTSRVIPVNVDSLPNVGLTLVDTICSSASPITLQGGTPLGGIYSGNGVISDSIFNPALAGIGNTTIMYKYSNGGCADSSISNIYIQPAPTIFFSIPSSICFNSNPIPLNIAFPLGGTFTGPGVTGNQFDPALTNGGLNSITYTFSDVNGCTSSTTQNIQVDTFQTSTFSVIADLCINNGMYSLTEGQPSGGVYSGIGVVNAQFDPMVSGIGSHTLSYINSNQCGNDTSFQTITVQDTPVVNLPVFASVCADAPPIKLSSGTPSGGIYSGIGVTNGTFNPSVSGVGTF